MLGHIKFKSGSKWQHDIHRPIEKKTTKETKQNKNKKK